MHCLALFPYRKESRVKAVDSNYISIVFEIIRSGNSNFQTVTLSKSDDMYREDICRLCGVLPRAVTLSVSCGDTDTAHARYLVAADAACSRHLLR